MIEGGDQIHYLQKKMAKKKGGSKCLPSNDAPKL